MASPYYITSTALRIFLKKEKTLEQSRLPLAARNLAGAVLAGAEHTIVRTRTHGPGLEITTD